MKLIGRGGFNRSGVWFCITSGIKITSPNDKRLMFTINDKRRMIIFVVVY